MAARKRELAAHRRLRDPRLLFLQPSTERCDVAAGGAAAAVEVACGTPPAWTGQASSFRWSKQSDRQDSQPILLACRPIPTGRL